MLNWVNHAILIFKCLCLASIRKANQIISLKTKCINYSNAVSLICDCLQSLFFKYFCLTKQFLVFLLCHLIHFVDRRTRKNIMELI